MKTKQKNMLIIRLSVSALQDEYWWLPSCAQSKRITSLEAAQYSQTTPAIILLEAVSVRVVSITLPAKVKASEVGLLLEEQLCQTLEETLILPVQRNGRHLKVALIDQNLAQKWHARLKEQNIRIARWIPESCAFAAAWTDNDDLLLCAESQQWLFIPQREILLSNRWVDLLQVWLPASHSVQKISVNDLPEGAVIPWLARTLPKQINLWPQPWHSNLRIPKWSNIPPATLPVTTPWLLLLIALVSVWLVKSGAPSTQQVIAQQYQQFMGEDLQIDTASSNIEKRLQQVTKHREWQLQRLDVWERLQKQLQLLPHISVSAMHFTEQGVRIELSGVMQKDQFFLRTVGGHWSFSKSLGVLEQIL